jgi:uncharacterized protein involved in exopolysaccharide biosynthesis
MNHADPKVIARSQKLFQRLLVLYPKRHRQEYGPAIAQNFHDQSLDAWRNGRGFGLMFLWVRVVPDLLKTSVLEHFVNLKNGKFMLKRLVASRFGVPLAFLVFFSLVFLLIFGACVAGVMTQPKWYTNRAVFLAGQKSGSSEVKNASSSKSAYHALPKSDVQILQSDYLLAKAFAALNFNEAARARYNFSNDPADPANLQKLRNLFWVQSSYPLFSLHVYAKDPQDAASIANTLVATLQDFWKSHPPAVKAAAKNAGVPANVPEIRIVSLAVPNARAVLHPASRDALIRSAKVGSFLGVMEGGLVAFFVYRRRKINKMVASVV